MEMMEQQMKQKFKLPVPRTKRNLPPMEVVEEASGKDEVETNQEGGMIMSGHDHVAVTIKLGRKRYAAVVPQRVIASIRDRQTRDGKENELPAVKVERIEAEPMKVKGAGTQLDPLRILQPWDS